MQLRAEEKFNQAVVWVTQEIKKESLADPEEFVRFEFKSSSDSTIPSIDDQKLAIKALINAVALKIVENIYPYPSYISSAVASIGGLEPSGYVLQTLQPNFEIIRGQPHRIHDFIKEKNKVKVRESENTSPTILQLPTQTTDNQAVSTVVWPEDFKWKDENTYDLAGKGQIEFMPKENNNRRIYFKMMTDNKDWVETRKMSGETGEEEAKVKIKLNQIRQDKINAKGLSNLLALESRNNRSKPSAYRLVPYPNKT